MKFSFVTPAYNSEGYIEMMLDKHLGIYAYWYNKPLEGSESDLYFKSLK